jgi:hypothetical protein
MARNNLIFQDWDIFIYSDDPSPFCDCCGAYKATSLAILRHNNFGFGVIKTNNKEETEQLVKDMEAFKWPPIEETIYKQKYIARHQTAEVIVVPIPNSEQSLVIRRNLYGDS